VEHSLSLSTLRSVLLKQPGDGNGGIFMETLNIQMVWEAFRTSLRQFILSRVSNEQDAMDILQEVFIKIHFHLPSLKDEDKLHSWVYQITRNTIIDFYRSRGKNKNQFLTPELENKLFNETDRIAEDENKNTIVSSWLKDMIEQLPDKYKQALLLTEFEEITQKELAERLGISISGSKSRVQRARERLKKAILECCHLEFDYSGNVLDYRRNKGNCSCREIYEEKR
jgi:RNA polymerase sigma-70 factor (ECF subfamily)